MSDTEWCEFFAFRPRLLICGERAAGWLMRRRWNGAWQFRKPTPEEEFERFNREAW